MRIGMRKKDGREKQRERERDRRIRGQREVDGCGAFGGWLLLETMCELMLSMLEVLWMEKKKGKEKIKKNK